VRELVITNAPKLVRSGRVGVLVLAQVAACNDARVDDDGTRDVTHFLQRLREVDHLPTLEESHTSLASTWDRTGGNLDGWGFDGIDGNINVLLDVDGPGCIHRMFTGRLGEDVAGSRIQIFLDEEETPLFDLPVDRFFADSGGPFTPPLVSALSYHGVLMPIPFSEHVRVQLEAFDIEPRWGGYWQIAYTVYGDDVPVESMQWPPDEHVQEEVDRLVDTWLAALEPPEWPEEWTVSESISIAAGATESIALEGCGEIRHMRVGVTPRTPDVLRGIQLRITWDGLDFASIDVPLGYFFGHGDYEADDTEAHFDSLLLGAGPSHAYMRLPMPFADGAVLSFDNLSGVDVTELSVDLDVTECESLPPDRGRLHAVWHERPAALADAPTFGELSVPGHIVLEREGRGKYVGTLLGLDWPHEQWWGEGDWLIWSDEDGWPPSYHGTGTEEYFNSGYTLFDRMAISGDVKPHPGPVMLYSFHLNDVFSFEENIRVAVETLGLFDGDTIIQDTNPLWRTTAYYYALPAQPAGSVDE
jgi:hypothetical protein